MNKKLLIGILTTILLIGSLTGCSGADTQDTASVDAVNSSGNENVKVITVGSGNGYKPYCYLDDDGNAVGYEYALLKAIDELLPEYEFKYETMSFDNLLLSLDTNKIDVAAHQYEYTDKRNEKYLFSKEFYTKYITYITVLSDNNDIKSIDDLQGKKTLAGGTTSATNQLLTDYNAEHTDNPIEIVNVENTITETTVASLKSGAIDAVVLTDLDTRNLIEQFGNGENILKNVGTPINDTNTYYVFSKNNTELQELFDQALVQLKKSGKLAELSNEWLGADYTGD